MSGARRRLARSGLALALLVPLAALAQVGPEASRGLAWLQAQVRPDGALASEASSVATPLQARSEALRTLQLLGAPAGAQAPLQAAIALDTDESSEYLARRAFALAAGSQAQQQLLARLLGRQDPVDGGYGGELDFGSNALDTALVLLAQRAAGAAPDTTVANALAYLAASRNADGSYSSNGQVDIHATLQVLQAASGWSGQLATASITAPAQQWLLAQRNGALEFGSVLHNAQALATLSGLTAQPAVLQPLADALKVAQSADGSWNGDPYLTAVAVRALYLLTQAPPPVTTAALRGVVVDAATGAALEGVTVQLLAAATQATVSDAAGQFSFPGAPAAGVTLRFAKIGYAGRDVAVTLSAGQSLNVGAVPIAPAALTATLSGVVRNQSGAVLSGVTVAVGTASALTDAAGAYQLTGLPPGTASVTVSLSSYQTLNLSLDLAAGASYAFSPRLTATNGTPPATTSITGIVLDGATGKPIAGASAKLGASTQATTATGAFTFANAGAGGFTIAISASGYGGVNVAGVAAAGVNNIGNIALSRLPSTSSVAGIVTEAASGSPLAGVVVKVDGQGTAVQTGADGRYSIGGLTGLAFTVRYTLTGYTARAESLALSEPGAAVANVALQAETVDSDLAFLKVATAGANYPASGNIPLLLTLANNGASAAAVQVAALVAGPDGSVVHEYLASPVIGWEGAAYGNNPLTVAASSTLELALDWNASRLPAGQYTVRARAFDANGRVAAEGEGGFAIGAGPILAGGVAADPPLAQAGAGTPVAFSADLANNGNTTLAAGDLQLRVTLETPDPSENRQARVDVHGHAIGAPMKSAARLVGDAAGNIYTVNAGDGKLIKIAPDGAQAVLALLPSSTSASDLLLAADGNVWVAHQSPAKLYRVTPDGASASFALTSLTQLYALDAGPDGSLYLSGQWNTETRLVRRSASGEETILWRNGLATPTGIVKDAQGNYVVANAGDGTLVKIAADGAITTFVRGLTTPKGIAVDSEGNYYVADAGANSVVRVTPAGVTSVVASGLKQPYDLKFDQSGTLYVSNTGDDSIVRVQPNGAVDVVAKGLANGPQGMRYDAAGTLWLANDDGTLRRKDAQDNIAVVATGLQAPHGLALAANGDVLVAEYNSGKVTRVSNGVKTTFADGLQGPWGVAIDDDGNVYVTERNANQVARFDAAGTRLGVTETALNGPTTLRTGAGGDVFVQNNGNFVSRRHDGALQAAARPFNYTYWAPDRQNGGFVAVSSTSIVRIGAAGGVATVKSNLPFTPNGIAFDAAGAIVLLDGNNKKVQKLEANGDLSVLALLPAQPNAGELLADAAGTLFVRLSTGPFYRIEPGGEVTLLGQPVGETIFGWNAGGAGVLAIVASTKTYRFDTVANQATVWAARGRNSASPINGVAIDGAGNLVAGDTNNHVLTVLSAAGAEIARHDGFVTPHDIVWTGSELRIVDAFNHLSAFTGSAPPVRKAGQMLALYLAQSGADTFGVNSNSGSTNIYRYTGTGTLGYETWTSVANAKFSGIAARGDGSLALGESGNSRVLLMNASKAIVKDFAGLRAPQGLAFDQGGRLYVANNSGGTVARFDALPNPAATTFARVSSPVALALDAGGQLYVAKSNGVDRLATNASATTITSTGTYGALLVDGATVLAADGGNGQLRRLQDSGGTNSWQVFAAGLTKPVALRSAPGGEVYVVSQTNNTVVKYADGKLDTAAVVPAGMNALSIRADGSVTVGGNGGVVGSIAADGSFTDLNVGPLVNERALAGVLEAANGKLYVLANDTSNAGNLYEVSIAQPVAPPAPGTVVYQSATPMASLDSNGNFVHFELGKWVPPYGGDFRIESWREGVDGKATNFLHVGPNAQSLLSAARSEVPPGDSELAMCLDLKGADFTTVSRVEMGQVRPVSMSGTPEGMAGDRSGRLYVTDTTSLYRTDASGASVKLAGGMSLARGLAADSQENFYVASRNTTSGRFELVRIDLQGTKTVVADLGVTAAGGVQTNSLDEVLVGSPSKLLKVDRQGVVTTVATAGLPSPRGIAVDGRDNVYVQNDNALISMIKPDGTVTNIFSRADGTVDPVFEGDGYPNIAADCADNFYIAPYNWKVINQLNTEEHSLAQVVARTGTVALLFDTAKIDATLNDIDYLAFDRFSNRVLMWTHGANRIWQVPVTCGAIGVEAHLVAQPGQALSGATRAPSATVPLADGRTEYVWSLRDVTAQGAQVCFAAGQRGVRLGEERKSIDSGFISFQNSFTGGDVRVPLAVPRVRAANLVALQVSADLAEYPANTQAQVSTTLTNANPAPVTGNLNVQVFDAQGILVGKVTEQAVTLGAGETIPVSAPFAIGAIVPAQYTVRAVLLGAAADLASGQTAFKVLASGASASARSTVATDRPAYASTDRVAIASRVVNQSANVILENLGVTVQVFDAAGAQLFSRGYALAQLLPGAARELSTVQELHNLAPGSYTVRQLLTDSSGAAFDQPTTSYTVLSGAETGVGLSGSVTVVPKAVEAGASLALAVSADNNGNADLADLPLKVSIVDPAQARVIAEFPYVQTIKAGGHFSAGANWIASGPAGARYAAVLSAQVGSRTLTLGQDEFTLMARPIKLELTQSLTNGSRVLVLVSCKQEEPDTGADGKPAPCLGARAATIGAALTTAGASYTIVTDEAAFRTALRSGRYNTVWVSGRQDKLHDDLAGEVRELVFGGLGLVVDGEHDQRNKLLDSASGVRWRGKYGETGLPVTVAGPLLPAAVLATSGRALDFELAGGVQQAAFGGAHANGAAIVTNAYGAGRAILFGFDLAGSLAAAPGWQAAFEAGLKHVLPPVAANPLPGTVLPLLTRITNQAQAVDVAVESRLPPGAVFLGAQPAASYKPETGVVGWTFPLAAGATRELVLEFALPAAGGALTVQTVVSTVKGGVATPYGEPLVWALAAGDARQSADEARAGLAALQLATNRERQLRDRLAAQLQGALAKLDAGTAAGIGAAIGDLVEVASGLEGITSADTAPVRRQLARVLKDAQWRWSRMQQP